MGSAPPRGGSGLDDLHSSVHLLPGSFIFQRHRDVDYDAFIKRYSRCTYSQELCYTDEELRLKEVMSVPNARHSRAWIRVFAVLPPEHVEGKTTFLLGALTS